MFFRTVDVNYLLDAINHLKNGKASGQDRVSTTTIRDVKDLIAKPLTITLNDSVINGVFPDRWKPARVTPIFQSDVKNDANNLSGFIAFFSISMH